MTGTDLIWHSAADAFPLMTGADFDALVADIAENGLRRPITRLPDGTGLDGRNRLAACERAGVEARFDVYDGDDPAGFVISENVIRRHLRPGQRAMAAARMMPERQNGKKRPSGRSAPNGTRSLGELAERFGVSDKIIQQARALLDRAPDLAELADAGQPIGQMYRELVDREKTAAAQAANLSRIAERDSDLAEAVEAGSLDLTAALAEAAERERNDQRQAAEIEQSRRDSCTRIAECVRYLDGGAVAGEIFLADAYPHERQFLADGMRLTRTRIDNALAFLAALREGIGS
jgi:hypothetical protein